MNHSEKGIRILNCTFSRGYTKTPSLVLGLLMTPTQTAAAQTIPGPADVGRVKPEERQLLPEWNGAPAVTIPERAPISQIPPGAQDIHLSLKQVHITGATVFSPEQLRAVYAPYLGHDITLDQVYRMADAITKIYRDAGYFLSMAYVPVQHIKDGIVTIQVVEGYVGQIDVPEDVRRHDVVQAYLDRLMAQRPLTSAAVESLLLRLNDLPGYSFRAVLSSVSTLPEGDIKLTLTPTAKSGQGVVSSDNYSSRFLGPNELAAEYSASLGV